MCTPHSFKRALDITVKFRYVVIVDGITHTVHNLCLTIDTHLTNVMAIKQQI